MERPAPYVTDALGVERLPFEAEGLKLAKGAAREVYEVTPFRGREDELNSLLQEACGVTLPGTLGASFSDKFQLLWCRAGTYLLVTPEAFEIRVMKSLGTLAVMRQTTDALVSLSLTGTAAADFLARQLNFDLDMLPEATPVVTELFCQPAHILRTEDGFDLRVPRSFASDMLERAEAAMARYAALRSITPPPPRTGT